MHVLTSRVYHHHTTHLVWPNQPETHWGDLGLGGLVHEGLVVRSVKIHVTQSSVYATRRENFHATQPWKFTERNSLFTRCQDTSAPGQFGTKTLRGSAPNNRCRSVRTLRHQFFVGAELSHGHFGLVPNCLKTKGNGQSKPRRDRRHSQ